VNALLEELLGGTEEGASEDNDRGGAIASLNILGLGQVNELHEINNIVT
jgi:hypothetical protein